MKHQNDAAPARRCARQAVQAAGAKSGEAGADERIPHGHGRNPAERNAQSFRNALRGRTRAASNRSLINLGDNKRRSLTRLTIAPRHRPRRKALGPDGRNAKRARPDRRGRRRARRRFRFAYRSAARLGRVEGCRRRLALSGLRIRRCLVSRPSAPRAAPPRSSSWRAKGAARPSRSCPSRAAVEACSASSSSSAASMPISTLACSWPGRAWSAAALLGLLAAAARQAEAQVDSYGLAANQPRDWQGRVDPLAALGGWASPSFGYKSELPLAFEAWRDARCSKIARRKLRKKAERLASMGAVSHAIARDEAEAARTLDALIALRCDRARREGTSMHTRTPMRKPFFAVWRRRNRRGSGQSCSFHQLMLDERAVAAFAALSGRDRRSGLVIADDVDPEIARCSPGELILHTRSCARRSRAGSKRLSDLGVGEARYKNECCEATEVLFDAFVAASPLGRLAALACRLERRVKRIVKHSERLSALAARLRRRNFKRPPGRPAQPPSR